MSIIEFNNSTIFSDEILNRVALSNVCEVLTGAGVSAESGVPTFRDALTGMWSNFSVEDFATPEAFRRDPKKVWDWYEHRRAMAGNVKPNPGHYAFAGLEEIIDDFWLVTQNVDGLHSKAGSKNLLELHGNIHKNKCFDEDTYIDELPESDETPPKCQRCEGYIRPAVVWFHESLPEYEISKAMEMAEKCDLFIVAGTSAAVFPAAQLPIIAKQNGAFVIEANLEKTPITGKADVTILGKTGEVMPALVEQSATRVGQR